MTQNKVIFVATRLAYFRNILDQQQSVVKRREVLKSVGAKLILQELHFIRFREKPKALIWSLCNAHEKRLWKFEAPLKKD